MFDDQTNGPSAIVIGAGIGGLAAALRLQSKGLRVTLLDRHGWPGGKMRTVPSQVGPIDAGPTVLTMRHVFDDLFQSTGVRLDDHVTLVKEPLLARHFWRDGSQLDLVDHPAENAEAIQRFAGRRAQQEFLRFNDETAALFDQFNAPMMQSADPALTGLARAALSAPQHLHLLSPFASMSRHLKARFSDPRLAQLFGRYATYVGGAPAQSPALLSLIWQAEARGVWRVQGGMHKLATALAYRFRALGGALMLDTPVEEILASEEGIEGVHLANGTRLAATTVVFAGDPRALATGKLGAAVAQIAPQTKKAARSLSARVWSFAARVAEDPGLVHHNVFFGQDPQEEFQAIRKGQMPKDPTIYVCAQDRSGDTSTARGAERFEFILNAAPLTQCRSPRNEEDLCHQRTFPTLTRFGLRFENEPSQMALTTPAMFEEMFPASAGALYGQSPHGMTAALKRPRARTAIPGLYLAGGGTHPGAGVPMAALSGQHAAEAILQGLVST